MCADVIRVQAPPSFRIENTALRRASEFVARVRQNGVRVLVFFISDQLQAQSQCGVNQGYERLLANSNSN